MDRLLNFLHQWRLRAEIAGHKAADSAKLHYERTVNAIYLGAIALLILSGPGIILAWIGYQCGANWLLGLGQMLIALGGVVATGMLCLFYLKVGVLGTHSLRVLDGLLEFFSQGKIKNFFSKELGAHIRNELLNAFAWVATFCIWCAVVPVWKYPISLLLGALLAFFFAFASTYLWTFVKKPIGKFFIFTFWVIAFFLNSANAFTAGAVTDWTGEKGELIASYIRNDSDSSAGQRDILEAKREFRAEVAEARLQRYRQLAKRQIAIMAMPTKKRNSDKIQKEFARNASRMAELEEQTRPAKQARRRSTVPPAISETETRIIVPTNNALAQTGNWFGSNWGWILLTALVIVLFVLACVGFAIKEKWLAGTATITLFVIALIGSAIWVVKNVDLPVGRQSMREFSSPNIPPANLRLQVPLQLPQGASRPNSGASVSAREFLGVRAERAFSVPASEPPRPPARGLREALDEIVPEQPGDWH